jgi:type II secretory pathway component PulF
MFGTRFSLKEQGFFFKRLSYLMNAHISLFESLQVLEGQSDSKKHRKMFRQIILDVSQGQSLSRSFKKLMNFQFQL